MQQKIDQHIDQHIEVFQQVVAPRRGNKILILGNGGSAADAQHFAAELVGRFLKNRSALPAIALTTDQVEALAKAGDVVVGISTSGHSKNVQQALALAKTMNGQTVALLGRDGGTIAEQVDLALTVATPDTPRIQEVHLTIIHILCDLIESVLFPENS
ncbi:MAG: hypothetical protein B6I37_05250 [Desulfobacteraceae bacterium 4572_35.2]|nr:MAG: hypothetical protein B6I37_05250 [Desulfobacteraceae bacterium 4572_35.2]